MVDEQGQVAQALAQRRNMHLVREKAVVEVAAEPALFLEFLHVPVGGGDDARIAVRGRVGPERVVVVFLEEPQQFHLRGRCEVTDLVEEEGAARGLLDESGARLDGAGEGALAMAEEFTGHKFRGQGTHVHG